MVVVVGRLVAVVSPEFLAPPFYFASVSVHCFALLLKFHQRIRWGTNKFRSIISCFIHFISWQFFTIVHFGCNEMRILFLFRFNNFSLSPKISIFEQWMDATRWDDEIGMCGIGRGVSISSISIPSCPLYFFSLRIQHGKDDNNTCKVQKRFCHSFGVSVAVILLHFVFFEINNRLWRKPRAVLTFVPLAF